MSAADDLHEELRAAEERLTNLRHENQALQGNVLRRTHVRSFALGVTLLCVMVFIIASLIAQHLYVGAAKIPVSPDHLDSMKQANAEADDCRSALQKSRAKLKSCESDRGLPEPQERPDACACLPGDPLCSCL